MAFFYEFVPASLPCIIGIIMCNLNKTGHQMTSRRLFMKVIRRKNPNNRKTIEERQSPKPKSEDRVSIPLSKDLKENLGKFKAFLEESADAVFREFKLGVTGIPCALVYIDGLTDKNVIHEAILKPMMYEVSELNQDRSLSLDHDLVFDFVKEHAVTVADIKEVECLDKAMLFVMSGEAVLLIDGFDKVLVISTRGWPARGVNNPEDEEVIRGPKEGFTETLRVNTALIRRKCKDPNMVIKTITLGRRSKTDVAYVYIKGITREELVKEVEERLNKIDIDQVIDSGQLEQLIQDNNMTPFPQVQATERPDKTVAGLLEGRVAILVDNSPYALIVPATFNQFFQSPEDYNERWILSSFIRLLRWISSFVAVFTPAIYIAILTYHPSLIPTKLALSISASRSGVPFPSLIEALLMESTLELLRESGARLPKAIGQTIGIVGGLIIGDAAVRAGITSPITVVIVAITAIASFVIPTYSTAIGLRTMRFPLMILAGFLGLYGVVIGFILLNIHMASIKSFGVEFMTPQSPIIIHDLRDFVIRAPYMAMKRRPVETDPIDMIRMDMV